ncbi:MAG: glycosyltransferase family 9 protein [Candidatus Eremiobacteraeota bacterium]|nr:glycosyltransferase family 9 protein [Candidatus Eremiobacteraeota bacterium]MBV8497897.1 glycosyltransferase family 9 protein [Candidatus Eremiobacteraeota bacterium]
MQTPRIQQTPKRALLYCAGGGIGDSLVASLVARALRRRFTLVDALTLPAHRSLLERVPDVDRTLVDEGEERALARRLALHSYDACVVTWATARTARVPALAAIPVRVGQARRFYSFRFTERIVVRSERGDVTSHWSQILLDFARALDCDTDDGCYRFVPTARDEREASELVAASSPFIILNPCNAVASARGVWPLEGWASLARALWERFGMRVVVTGSAADARFADGIADLVQLSDVVSVAGKTTVGGFGALARKASAFVGITTGSMHVAAAVGCPTVGIFPFQSDFPDRWAPLGAKTAVVRPSFPCHRGDTKERCRDYACVAELDLPRILAAVESLRE